MLSNTCFAEDRKNKDEATPPVKKNVKTEDGSKTKDSTQSIATAKKHKCKTEYCDAQTKVRTTTNAKQSSRDSPGTKPSGQGCFSRTSGCDACSGRPFIGFRLSGAGFYSTLGTIDGSGTVSSRTLEGQGGSAASPFATLGHPGRSKRGPSSHF